jgi:hypothetical protein
VTAAEWDAADHWRPLVDAAADRRPWRVWRLACAAMVRDARRFQFVKPVADAVALAERFADGLVEPDVVAAAQLQLRHSWDGTELPLLLTPTATRGDVLATAVARRLDQTDGDPGRRAAVLREVLGNPFRPVRWDAAWDTRTVHALAGAAYAAGDFSRLTVLADALDDAGCDSEELLAHLRGPGPHARGCWALDTVLGRR